MHPAEPGDTYLDDGISYRLTVEYGVLVTDRFHLRADGDPEPDWSKCNCGAGPRGVHSPRCALIEERRVLDGHGVWWWRDEVPEGIEPEIMAHHR